MATFVLLGSDHTMMIESEVHSLCKSSQPLVVGIGTDPKNSFVNVRLTLDDLRTCENVEDKLMNADVICFGETSIKWVRLFRRRDFDAIMKRLAQTDKVICGIGEGAALLCSYGQSCTDKITSRRVTGFGLVELVFCPHVVTEPQRTGWLKAIMKRTTRIPALALDAAAVILCSDRYRVLSLPEGSRARKCYWLKNQYYTENLKSNEWHPIHKLMQKG